MSRRLAASRRVNKIRISHTPWTKSSRRRSKSYQAGAAVWHVHARDDDGLPSKNPVVMKEMIDRVRDRCPDVITSVIPYVDYNLPGVDQIRRCVDYMVEAGPHYMETAVLLTTTGSFSEKFTYTVTAPLLRDIVTYLDKRRIKPEFQGHSYQALRDTYDWILAQDLASKPPLVNLMAGFHGYSHASPIGPDPWGYVYLIEFFRALSRPAAFREFAPVAATGSRSRPWQFFSATTWFGSEWKTPSICIPIRTRRSDAPPTWSKRSRLLPVRSGARSRRQMRREKSWVCRRSK